MCIRDRVRILLIRYSRMVCRQMIYAPADAAAFPKVPTRKSMSLMQFCSSAHPKPCLLYTSGKSYATGYLAREWNKNGKRTITQKFIQTGNVGHSEDIDLHRRIMEIPFTQEDQEGLTMPEIFSYPASPHLASRLDHRPIDFDKIKHASEVLSERYDCVLLEGAGLSLIHI